ncbi:MAG: hypothetical protein AMXMBFR56_37210 [Polyangiaceae bacterium]
MQAENSLCDATYAEGHTAGFPKTAHKETYAAASPGASTHLIFPGPRMQVRTQIAVGERRYDLKDVFVIDLEYMEEDDQVQVFASHRTLPVHGYGADQPEALRDFCEVFDFQWRHLVDVPEESLTPGGKRRRQAMLNAVEKVAAPTP